MIFDPKSPLAGVAWPIFDVMSATTFVPTLNGEMDPAEAVRDRIKARAERALSLIA